MSSPARTFIKQAGLQGKEIYILLTYNGNSSKGKETIIKEKVNSKGTSLKGFCKIIIKEKTEEEIKKMLLPNWGK